MKNNRKNKNKILLKNKNKTLILKNYKKENKIQTNDRVIKSIILFPY